MLQTLERNVHTFDAQVLTPAGAAALAELTGPAGLPFLPPDRQRTALENGQIIADYAGQPELQAAAALMPLYDDAPLPTSLRAAGYGADGQGAVLTPPVLNENYTQLRHFLRMALRWATERYASYHIWAVQPLTIDDLPACEDLCAQYLSAGLTLRGLRPMVGTEGMLIFSARGCPTGRSRSAACIWTTRRSPACWNAGMRRRISAGVSRGWNCCCGPAVEWKFSQIPIIIRVVPQGGLPLCPR